LNSEISRHRIVANINQKFYQEQLTTIGCGNKARTSKYNQARGCSLRS
jgi:hypothetical protein